MAWVRRLCRTLAWVYCLAALVTYAVVLALALAGYALLHKYQGRNLNLERAQVLAYKVMEEAIAVDAYGLVPPIDVWQISEGGIKNLREVEKAALAEAANRLREAEIGLLLNKEIR